MATYKVYRKGNFLEVVDLDNGQVWNTPVYDAFIEKLHDPLQYRYRFHFSDGKFLDRILLEEIVDENSAPYTAQSFDTFRTCKLGYVPIGFGCGESINIPQDFLDLTDTPDSYSGAANQYVRVNATATGLEFFALDLSIYAEIANLGATAFSNDYNDLDNLPVISSTNLYNADDALTGNRTVTGDGHSLTFDNVDTITTKSKYSSSTSLIFDYKDSGNNSRCSLSAYGIMQMTPEANGLTGINFRTGDSLRNGIQAADGSQFLVQGINALNLYAYNGDLTMRTQYGGDIVVKTNDVERMRISNSGSIKTISPSASALDTAFGVRNNTDTDWLGRFIGSGVFEINQSATRMLRFTTNDYTLGVDGNGFMTYSSPKINGVLTGHRIGRVDGNGLFTEIGVIQSNDTYNSVRFLSINGQTNNLLNLQDHNGNIRFGFNPQTGKFELTNLPTSAGSVGTKEVFMDDNGDGTSTLKIKN